MKKLRRINPSIDVHQQGTFHGIKRLCASTQQIRSGSSLGDGVDSINNSREVAKEGEKQADPELRPATKLEEDTERRQDDGQQDVYAVSCSLVCHLLNSSERYILLLRNCSSS